MKVTIEHWIQVSREADVYQVHHQVSITTQKQGVETGTELRELAAALSAVGDAIDAIDIAVEAAV